MRIRIIDIPEKGLYYKIDDSKKSLKVFDEEIPILERVSGELYIRKHEAGRVSVKGNVRVVLELTCSRCLKTYRFEIVRDIDESYHPIDDIEFGERKHLKSFELDTCYYSEGELDVESVYMEPIYLAIPMKPLCSDNCKGICPICGKDLNEDSCDCNRGVRDPRWKVLVELKEKLKGE
ncbi:MAG: YceD family protein [Thermosulfidibacteraceae bacterium]